MVPVFEPAEVILLLKMQAVTFSLFLKTTANFLIFHKMSVSLGYGTGFKYHYLIFASQFSISAMNESRPVRVVIDLGNTRMKVALFEFDTLQILRIFKKGAWKQMPALPVRWFRQRTSAII